MKLKKILKLNKINYLLCTEIENISWLLNIRGYDSLYSPLTNGKLIIRADGKITFFTNLNKINPKIKRFFKKNVTFIKENFFLNYLKQIKKSKILIDKRTCSFDCEKIISSSNKIIRTNDPINLLKAIKNKTEITNTKIAHLFDGIALTKFIFWLKNNYNKF